MLLTITSAFSYADVYKCQGSSGQVIYQKSPCPGVDDAKPVDLKQPSPEQLLKMQEEAELRALDEQDRRRIAKQHAFEEARRQAEIRAISARKNAWDNLNYDIQKSREESERRQAEWDCQEKRRVNSRARCDEFMPMTTDGK